VESDDFLSVDNEYPLKGDDMMKKVIIVVLVLVLALAVAGPGLAASPATAGQAQEVCPVLGGKINKGLCADYQGQRVYFCCPGCVGPFQKDPEKYLQKMKGQGVTPEKSPARQ
jgi:YHS domain-containing protein